MNIDKVNKIREAVSFFEDAELVTLIDESSLLLKNKKNNSVWKVNYTFENEFILDTTAAEMVSEGDKIELPLNPKEFAKAHFGKVSIEEMKTNLMNVVFKKQTMIESIQEEEKTLDSSFELLTETEKNVVSNFFEKYKSAILNENESVRNFISNVAYIFENKDIKKTTFLNPKTILDLYSEKTKIKKTIYENSEIFKNFQEEVESYLVKNKIDPIFVNEIIEGFDPSMDMSTKFTKNVLQTKKEHKLELNISETVKDLKKIQKQIFSEFDSSKTNETIKSYNEMCGERASSETLYYLRFGQNYWNRENLKSLLEDFKVVISQFTSISTEDFKKICSFRDTLDYMYRTANIDDEIVGTIIKEFNAQYGNVNEPINRAALA